MRSCNRKKWYTLYRESISREVVVLFAILFASALYGFWMVVSKAKSEGFSGGAFLTGLMILSPCYVFPIIIYYHRLGVRFLSRCRFDEIGIHCYYILWGSFTVRWDEIHTYGYFNSKAGYISMDLVFLSKDPRELYDKKKLYKISKERLILEYRPEFWTALLAYMPQDMKKCLEESVDTGRACFVKR